VIKLFAQALIDICSGEIDESLNPSDKSREHYFQRIGDKTASLFSAATESGAVLSEAPEETVQSLRDYGYNLGMGFQIVDDILDFTGRKETIGKPVVSDLSRGILTLPTILLLERPEADSLKEIFEGDKERGKKLIMEGVYKFGVLEECYHIAQGFRSRACLALEPLPRNPVHSSLIGLADHVIRRKR
jgi:geranylgeranyl pyrophosphate synthase